MLKRLLFSLLILGACLGYLPVYSQDSLPSVHTWTVTSQKTGAGDYTLTFSAPAVDKWSIYTPNQSLLDVKTVNLRLKDADIHLKDFRFDSAATTQLHSPIFDTLVRIFKTAAAFTATIHIEGEIPAQLHDTLFYTYGRGDEFYTKEVPFTVKLEGGVASSLRILIPSIDINHPVADCGDTVSHHESLWTIFIFGLLGGLIALLTPCVFPMIPLTVSFFTNKAGAKKKGPGGAILYGFFIFLIYVLLTLPFHIAGKTNPDLFNNISTNVWINLAFFAVFVTFALSFFGLFEITLPSAVANNASSRSGMGNVAGIFFMALTLAIVSFSCTGPILGTLLVGVANEGAWPLTAGAAGFGLALGLPFALFALFPRWLQAVPKSGGWMTDVKVVLGFIELGLAVKFLANADNVKQWGVLKREIFIGIWVLISACIVLYLLYLLRFKAGKVVKKFSFVRLSFIVLFTAFTIYLIPGLTNTSYARLELISGFPPPLCYSVYGHPVNCDAPLRNYEEALELARKEHKPILIDFTGWACVNCRRMEESVWTNREVSHLMKEEFILVSLYVDERTKLPAGQRTVYTSKNGTSMPIVTIGDRWTAFQVENFGATAQPQYAIVSPDEIALVKTKFYTKDAGEFAAWLRCGLQAFQQKK